MLLPTIAIPLTTMPTLFARIPICKDSHTIYKDSQKRSAGRGGQETLIIDVFNNQKQLDVELSTTDWKK